MKKIIFHEKIAKLRPAMKTKFLILIIFGLSATINAQIAIQNNVLSSSGSSFSDGSMVIDFTFGETFTSTLPASTIILTQGFQQPIRKKLSIIDPVVGVEDLGNYNFSVYPNPFNHEVTIELSSPEEIQITVYDNTGRLIYSDLTNALTTTLDLSALAVGNYQILLSSKNEFIGRIPVIKTP